MKLNLGCGTEKIADYTNIDIRREVDPDMVFDIRKGLPFPDNSIDEVRAYDFLEHIPIGETVFVVEEIYRVLKPNGVFEHFTPSTDGRGAFQDPGHKSFWNINSWMYYSDKNQHRILNGIKARFSGEIRDVMVDEGKRLIHTTGRLYAIKD